MVQLINNNTPNFKETHKTGSGIQNRMVPFGHTTIFGKAGDVFRLPASAVYIHGQIVLPNVSVQATGGSVQVDATLVSEDLAMNPLHDPGGHWVPDTTVAPGSIFVLKNAFTALRITFTGDAILYVAAC